MFIIHAVFQIKPEARADFLKEMETLVASSQAEEGNISYELYRKEEAENVFIMVESWKDEAAIAAHNASPHFTGFASRAPQYLAAPLDIKAYGAEPAKL